MFKFESEQNICSKTNNLLENKIFIEDLYQGVSNLEIHYSFYCITSAWRIPADGLTWHFRRFQ